VTDAQYQRRIVDMIEDTRVFETPLNKIREPGITFGLDSLGCLLRMTDKVTEALKEAAPNANHDMSSRDRLLMYSSLGGSIKNPEDLQVALTIAYNHNVHSLEKIHAILVLSPMDKKKLEKIAKSLLAAGKEAKAFSESLK